MRTLAVIGAGMIGREHVRFVHEAGNARLGAIVDPDPQARALAERLGVPHFDSHEHLLDRGGIDGAIVALPNAMHVPTAIALLDAGIPVLVEKPISDDVTSAHRLVTAARRTRVPVLVGHQRRHSPDIYGARQCVQSGQLGSLVAVNGLWFVRKHDSYFDAEWRRELGGGPFLINLIHDVDCFRYMVGDITSVMAISANHVRGFQVEDSAAVLLNFANGVVGTVILSDAVPSPWVWDMASGKAPYFPHTPADCFYLGGTKASLAVPSMEMWEHRPGGDWRDPLIRQRIPIDRTDPYRNQLAHFLDVIEGAAAPIVDAADGTRTLATTLAVARAARERCEVSVDDLLPADLQVQI